MSRAAASHFELLLLLAIFCAHLVSSRIVNENGRYVTVTLDGRHRIRGQTQQTLFENRTYFDFKGVPYAEAPIGDLRFKVSYIHLKLFISLTNFETSHQCRRICPTRSMHSTTEVSALKSTTRCCRVQRIAFS